ERRQPRIRDRPLPEPGEQPFRHGWVEQRTAGRNLSYGINEGRSANLLEQITGRTPHDRGEHRVSVVVGGQDQAPHRRHGRPDLPADVDAAAIRQPSVEYGDVRARGWNTPQRFGSSRGLAYDRDAVGFEYISDSAPDDFVVVEQKHPYGAVGGIPAQRSGIVH